MRHKFPKEKVVYTLKNPEVIRTPHESIGKENPMVMASRNRKKQSARVFQHIQNIIRPATVQNNIPLRHPFVPVHSPSAKKEIIDSSEVANTSQKEIDFDGNVSAQVECRTNLPDDSQSLGSNGSSLSDGQTFRFVQDSLKQKPNVTANNRNVARIEKIDPRNEAASRTARGLPHKSSNLKRGNKNEREIKKQNIESLSDLGTERTLESANPQRVSIYQPVSKQEISFDSFLRERMKQILSIEQIAKPSGIELTDTEKQSHKFAKMFFQTSISILHS